MQDQAHEQGTRSAADTRWKISYGKCDTGIFILKLFIDKVTMFERRQFYILHHFSCVGFYKKEILC